MHSVYNGNFSFLERLEMMKKHFGETFGTVSVLKCLVLFSKQHKL